MGTTMTMTLPLMITDQSNPQNENLNLLVEIKFLNLFFRKSYRITDIPGNGLISVSYILFSSLLWKFDDATLYRVRAGNSDLGQAQQRGRYKPINGIMLNFVFKMRPRP
jgi:hypothetical protein